MDGATQFRATLPPEEDLQTYKRSLVRFRNINVGSRINCRQIATANPKILIRLTATTILSIQVYQSFYLSIFYLFYIYSSLYLSSIHLSILFFLSRYLSIIISILLSHLSNCYSGVYSDQSLSLLIYIYIYSIGQFTCKY